jgi:Helix-turn-helix domain
MATVKPELQLKPLYSIPETENILGTGKTTVHALLRDGELEGIKIRKCRRITGRSIAALIDRGGSAASTGGRA